jgi:AraC family transcriptional activator of pobA
MNKIETLEQFYERKHQWMPDNIRSEIGHFNLFNIEPYVGDKPKPAPYIRRDYFKITLAIGASEIHYADKIFKVQKQALVFSNPFIPYQWEHNENTKGAFCIFNQNFFHQFGDLKQYSVFQPNGNHVFELSDEEVNKARSIFDQMFGDINSDYVHKYDALRTLVFELLHFAMKMQPAANTDKQPINATKRISTSFLELLERQFPVDDHHQKVHFRSASDFADQLNVHVNHLNRAVKEITQKTTSQIIAERVMQESKILLKHSSWNISEIAYALGFSEVTHFNNFFKKHTQLSPLKFRNV